MKNGLTQSQFAKSIGFPFPNVYARGGVRNDGAVLLACRTNVPEGFNWKAREARIYAPDDNHAIRRNMVQSLLDGVASCGYILFNEEQQDEHGESLNGVYRYNAEALFPIVSVFYKADGSVWAKFGHPVSSAALASEAAIAANTAAV